MLAGHYIFDGKFLLPLYHLLRLVVGEGESLVLRQGVGSSIGAGLQQGELGQSVLDMVTKRGKKRL